jgi:hypothetical protein
VTPDFYFVGTRAFSSLNQGHQHHRSSDNLAIAAKPAPPHRIAQHDSPIPPRNLFIGMKQRRDEIRGWLSG